ncbi:hypothetical protein [Pedobacter sp. BMA]|uniref:hypothetical protein n=1 Tax=Pedobacter sp. BMA TaxID=1663685 RepID=UPI000AA0B90E|nr:hypothetical protein [Pedobacter sp. BMA]
MKKRTLVALIPAALIILPYLSCKKATVVTEELPKLQAKSEITSRTTSSFVTNPKNLNIVMFVPTDNPALPDYKTRLTSLFVHFQSWLHTEMLRYGYDKYLGLSKVDSTGLVRFVEIPAAGPQSDYPYGSGSKILAEINTYKAAHPAEFSASSHTLILLPERTDGGGQPFYGSGKNCFALDNANMTVDKIPNASSNYIGGMLHELGHGLNLPHNHAKYASEEPSLGTSLMGSGNISFSKGQPTFLSEVDAAILNQNEVFQNTIPSGAAYESATAGISLSAAYNSTAQAINLSGTFTSNKDVSDILFYMDPDANGEGFGSNTNYNAVAWRFSPGAGNTISGTIPLNELYYKNNESYELEAKLLLKNGSVVVQSYHFDFLGGTPQIGLDKSAKFYQNANYGGYGVSLPPGEYTTANLLALGIRDNDVSSVSFGFGIKVIMYDGDNFTGSSTTLTAGSSYVSKFNDKASSIKVIEL